jgi:hypothetical protein
VNSLLPFILAGEWFTLIELLVVICDHRKLRFKTSKLPVSGSGSYTNLSQEVSTDGNQWYARFCRLDQ